MVSSEKVREYSSQLGSNQEHLYSIVYSVQAGCLVSTFEEKNSDLPEEEPVRRRSIELDGLVELAASRESIAALESRLAFEAQRIELTRVENQRREAERLTGFEGALADYQGELELVFVWQYAGRTIVIVDASGKVVWREADYPFHGKYLFAEYKKILERRYGARFKRLRLDLSTDVDALFDPE